MLGTKAVRDHLQKNGRRLDPQLFRHQQHRKSQLRQRVDAVNIQTWILVVSYLASIRPRVSALKHLRCVCRAVRATLMEVPSWKFLGINATCNYPDYPHVRKFLRGLVHPLIGLEPTYAPGRPNRQVLSETNRRWSQHDSPPLYEMLDIDTRRAASAPPIYRPRDDLDFYKGCDVGSAFLHGQLWVLTFRAEDRDMRHALEDRSQDGVHVDDDNLDGPKVHGWRTLQQVLRRSYNGAGMQG